LWLLWCWLIFFILPAVIHSLTGVLKLMLKQCNGHVLKGFCSVAERKKGKTQLFTLSILPWRNTSMEEYSVPQPYRTCLCGFCSVITALLIEIEAVSQLSSDLKMFSEVEGDCGGKSNTASTSLFKAMCLGSLSCSMNISPCRSNPEGGAILWREDVSVVRVKCTHCRLWTPDLNVPTTKFYCGFALLLTAFCSIIHSEMLCASACVRPCFLLRSSLQTLLIF